MSLESPAHQVNVLRRRPKLTKSKTSATRSKEATSKKPTQVYKMWKRLWPIQQNLSGQRRPVPFLSQTWTLYTSKVCRKKKEVHELHRSNNEHGMLLGTLGIDSRNKNKVLTKIHISIKPFHKRTTSITCKIDTGAEVNVISKTDYDKISANLKEKILGPLQVLAAYGRQTINCTGTCELYQHSPQ